MTTNRAIFFLALAVLCWSSGGVIVKSVHASSLTICCISAGFAAIVQWLAVRRITWSMSKTTLLAMFCFVSISLTVTFALRMTTAANAMLLQFCSPVFAGLFSAFVLKQPPHKEDKIAILLVLIGIMLFFADQLEFGHFIGNCFGLLSGVAVAAYTILMKLEKDRPQMELTVLGSLSIFLFCLPFAIASPPAASDIFPLVFCGIVVSGLGWVCYTKAIDAVSPTAALIITTPEAVLNPLLVAVFVGETPGMFAVIGAIIVLAAVSWYTIMTMKTTDGQVASDATDQTKDKERTLSPV